MPFFRYNHSERLDHQIRLVPFSLRLKPKRKAKPKNKPKPNPKPKPKLTSNEGGLFGAPRQSKIGDIRLIEHGPKPPRPWFVRPNAQAYSTGAKFKCAPMQNIGYFRLRYLTIL